MDSLGALGAFVQAADANGFTEAGRKLGVSPSAVSKAVQRLEERLGVRLFHRSTRSITLTPEGAVFLERCRRILCEVEAAETELTQAQSAPQGKLRISLPSIGILFMPRLAEFKRLYPQIEIEMDFSDRLVDVIEEGFDAVIRTGAQADSRLMVRKLGFYRKVIVGSPAYLKQAGLPASPEDLAGHACLIYRYPSTGKLDRWLLRRDGEAIDVALPASMVMNTLEPQICLAEQGLGLACIPDMAVRRQLEDGSLISVLDDYMQTRTTLRVLWPSSRHLSPKLRAFVDFAANKLLEPILWQGRLPIG
ncbi:LysR family transcriptional regulator [Pararhizobium polonicum]|uniref:HTH-type transcriptional regulator TtuA n=1 Tax=Pararhizobium polonicum TaxID=1612624 RepID=A0A1C7P3B1_9HYPH|nr:LysR family transcriptional regulator [Pararhizobium polonicum]OBZ95755.1 LysR family transcriptional regulator [Pararhizobium polonicum]